jgi:NitT/TauT family transport system permease protein
MSSITDLEQTDVPLEKIASTKVAAPAASPRLWQNGLAITAVWLIGAAITLAWPDLTHWTRTTFFGAIQIAIAVAIGIVSLVFGNQPRLQAFRHYGRWIAASSLIFSVWQILTAKTGLLPLPFFPPPQSVIEVFTDDYPRIFTSIEGSMLLLVPGYLIGSFIGFAGGVAVGWSKEAHYWGHPILRFVGPLPAIAWLPVAFYAFPGTQSASTFLIGLSTAFPVAVLTASGIATVNSDFYDIARTFGASRNFMIARIAIPAALPQVFVGLFMGLGASFAVLIIAEMIGVKAGLGWYLQWAQGWAAYANLYAALIVMSLLFSSLISLLFRVRDRTLAWQKGMVRW